MKHVTDKAWRRVEVKRDFYLPRLFALVSLFFLMPRLTQWVLQQESFSVQGSAFCHITCCIGLAFGLVALVLAFDELLKKADTGEKD